MSANRPGWYYVVGGRLRYRDENGWTEHYLDFDRVNEGEWPPPAPTTMLEQVLARQAADKAGVSRSRTTWWRRTRRSQ